MKISIVWQNYHPGPVGSPLFETATGRRVALGDLMEELEERLTSALNQLQPGESLRIDFETGMPEKQRSTQGGKLPE